MRKGKNWWEEEGGGWVKGPYCEHRGDDEVFVVGAGVAVHGGGSSAPWAQAWDVVIDLAGVADFPQNAVRGWCADRLLPHVVRAEILRVDWRDHGLPPLRPGAWAELAAAIAALPAGARVLVCCQGGHGRTGTALACLAAASGACGKQDPVEWVRARYCARAVETPSQEEYARRVAAALRQQQGKTKNGR